MKTAKSPANKDKLRRIFKTVHTCFFLMKHKVPMVQNLLSMLNFKHFFFLEVIESAGT